ncbi:nucleoside-diphosphate kinase [Candidatus Gracilibacteria bacterium]|nr:nucleoside-diphosphate kinase [Candidatus Gracilibacteria bacterium]
MAERSLLLLKPDVIHRSLVGTIIARIEARNFKIVALKMFDLTRETLDEHYAHIVAKHFYPEIVSYMTMGPVVGIIVEGKDVVAGMRQLCGATNPAAAEMGTLRADYSNNIGFNIIHGSDTPENAEIEILRFFDADEVCSYERKIIA